MGALGMETRGTDLVRFLTRSRQEGQHFSFFPQISPF